MSSLSGKLLTSILLNNRPLDKHVNDISKDKRLPQVDILCIR